jgi:predicted aldo/keto reductase-like oxidoreductase
MHYRIIWQIGNTFKGLGVRDKVIIGTKIYIPHEQRGMSPEKVKETYLRVANESLKRLQTDYVDILYSHSVNDLKWLNHPGILEALQLLKKQGKASFIGFSTHSNMADCISVATRSGLYDVILTMFNYTLWDDLSLLNALKNAHLKKIGLIAMKTQCPQYGGHWKDVPNLENSHP